MQTPKAGWSDFITGAPEPTHSLLHLHWQPWGHTQWHSAAHQANSTYGNNIAHSPLIYENLIPQT